MLDKFHEECGVFGSSGIRRRRTSPTSGCMRCSTADRRAPASPRPTATTIRVSKAMGHVNDVFNDTLAKLPGHIAIGHVRYSTAGEAGSPMPNRS